MQSSYQDATAQRTLTISLFANAWDTDPKPAVTTFAEFAAEAEYPALAADGESKESGPAWSPSTFDGERCQKNALMASMLGLDIDHGRESADGLSAEELRELGDWCVSLGVSYVIHSTWRSGKFKPLHRVRVVFPLAKDVSQEEYGHMWDRYGKLCGFPCDSSRRLPDGLFFAPRIPAADEEHYHYEALTDRPFLNPSTGRSVYAAVTTAKISTGPRDLEQWCNVLATTDEKHNSLRDAAFGLAAQDKRAGLDTPRDHWPALKQALEKNPKPVENWQAAEKTYSRCQLAGFEKTKVFDPLQTLGGGEAGGQLVLTDALKKKAIKELEQAIKTVKKFPATLGDQAYNLGRYASLLDHDTVRRELLKAAQHDPSNMTPRSELEATLEMRFAAGMSNPKGLQQAWEQDMTRDADGVIERTEENLVKLLENHPDVTGIFALNVRARKTWLMFEPPWPGAAGEFSLEYGPVDVALWARDVCRNKGFGIRTVRDAIRAIRERQSVDPFKDYLDTLRWDGESRLETWLVRVGGAEDCLYTRAVSKRWLIGAVARTYKPGCQMDNVLVLKGEQGIGKSSIFRNIVPEASLYTDSLPDITDKDMNARMSCFTVIEFAELAGFSRKDQERIKHFITQASGVARLAYQAEERDYPRRSVLTGTTNQALFLKDETGERRSWPVEITAQADIQWLRETREQLWAEAVHMYKNGEPWHLTQDEQSLASQVQEENMEDDANYDTFLTYAENLPANMRYAATGMKPNAGIDAVHVGVYSDQMDGDKPKYWTVPQVAQLLRLELHHNKMYVSRLLRRAGFRVRPRSRVDGKMITKFVKS